MQNKFSNEQVDNLIRGIVQALPASVLELDADGRPHGARNGERLVWFRYDSFKHRVSVHGAWPHQRVAGVGSNVYSPYSQLRNSDRAAYSEITVSASKSPVTIASEVARRFLPGYEAVFAKLVACRSVDEDAHYAKQDHASEFEVLLGDRFQPHSNDRRDRDPGFSTPSPLGYGEIKVSQNSIEFHLRSVPIEKARKLAVFLKTL